MGPIVETKICAYRTLRNPRCRLRVGLDEDEHGYNSTKSNPILVTNGNRTYQHARQRNETFLQLTEILRNDFRSCLVT